MDLDSFTLLPIQVDPATKLISTTSSDPALKAEIDALNAVHKNMKALTTPAMVPPPPMPVDQKRSQQITKLRESGNQSLKKGAHADAIRMYSFGLEMANGRPSWEPQMLFREEAASLYSNRAQAHMTQREWAEGAIDAASSLEVKSAHNSKAWYRLAKCNFEMGRLEDALDAATAGLEHEHEADLLKLKKEVEAVLRYKGRVA